MYGRKNVEPRMEPLTKTCQQMDKKRDFYELWQQHKLLKTMEMSEA